MAYSILPSEIDFQDYSFDFEEYVRNEVGLDITHSAKKNGGMHKSVEQRSRHDSRQPVACEHTFCVSTNKRCPPCIVAIATAFFQLPITKKTKNSWLIQRLVACACLYDRVPLSAHTWSCAKGAGGSLTLVGEKGYSTASYHFTTRRNDHLTVFWR